MRYEVAQELEIVREENNGFLRPQEVVEYAKNPNTVLHQYFDWDNDIAADKYRIAQARALIRVAVIVEKNTSEKVRAYVSLSSDRNEAGGYRSIAEVINDVVLVDTLLQDALKELASFQRKYNRLKEVSEFKEIFSSIERVVHKEQHEEVQATA